MVAIHLMDVRHMIMPVSMPSWAQLRQLGGPHLRPLSGSKSPAIIPRLAPVYNNWLKYQMNVSLYEEGQPLRASIKRPWGKHSPRYIQAPDNIGQLDTGSPGSLEM